MTFTTHHALVNNVDIAFWHERSEGASQVLVCVHGWPESKRIFSRVVNPLRDAGFDVVAPDLRGFGESGLATDSFYDVVSHARDIEALVFDHLGYESVVLVGGDLGGPVIQEMALRSPNRVERMVLFNSPLPMDKERMAGMRTRPSVEVMDYFIRQGTDADALASELNTEEKRAQYISEFYSTRLWAHPGAFNADEIAWHVEPFRDAKKLRASFVNYESAFDATKRSGKPLYGRNLVTPTLILFGTSDQVIYPDFDLMAAIVFDNHEAPIRIKNCGHFVPWEAAEEFIFRTVEFCRRK
ncbi:MAG: alpha/beta hydrolase [Actinomycetota bacterium]